MQKNQDGTDSVGAFPDDRDEPDGATALGSVLAMTTDSYCVGVACSASPLSARSGTEVGADGYGDSPPRLGTAGVNWTLDDPGEKHQRYAVAIQDTLGEGLRSE